MAFHQLSVWDRRHVRLPQRQLLLLQGVVGIGTRAPSVSSLELGSTRRRAHFRLGAFQSRFGRTVSERKESGLAESRASDSRRMDGEIRAWSPRSPRDERRKSRAYRKA